MSFATLGVPGTFISSLAERGVTAPFPIQTATLPDTLAGRDVLGRGPTGSGKTLAFAVPLVARLGGLVSGAVPAAGQDGRPRGLVLAPTRELASQIAETIRPLAALAGLSVMTIFGGVNQRPQVNQLRRGVDIVVATPGRLEDLMQQNAADLGRIAVTVLDEADHMADLGFLPSVTRILTATPRQGQRLLFSATLDRGIDRLSKQFLHDPLQHSAEPIKVAELPMTHHVFLVQDATQKTNVVHSLAAGTGRRLLFTRTKHQARKLARQLTGVGIPAVELHGNLSQNARERGLRAFAAGEVRVMVATDIAARGVHVDGIELVVHVDPPAEHKAYVHRSGRTARAGHGGDVVTLVLPEQRGDFRTLARAAKIKAEPVSVRSGDGRLVALVGQTADRVAPDEIPAAAAGAVAPAPAAAPRNAPARRAGNHNSSRGAGAGASAVSITRSRSRGRRGRPAGRAA